MTSNNTVTINLIGRVDSSNADQTEEAILMKIYETNASSVILNMKQLEYISSAGLRILLRLKKSGKDVSVTNVSPEIYEVLEITGFTELVTVKKA